MRRSSIFLDSFSGAASDLPKGRRNAIDVLRVIVKSPRVSTWDMAEHPWLCSCIADLKKSGLIVEDKTEVYPWHRYFVTDAGLAAIAAGGA